MPRLSALAPHTGTRPSALTFAVIALALRACAWPSALTTAPTALLLTLALTPVP